MHLFFQGVVDHVECIIGHHGHVNDDGIILPDRVVDHILLVRRNRDVKTGMDSVGLQIRLEVLPIVGGKKTQASTECDRIFLFD